MRRRPAKSRWPAVLSLACALLAGACSSTTAASQKSVSPGRSVPFEEAHNARADVSAGSCAEESGSWVLHGTVKNSGKTATGYQIVVDFVSQIGSTVLDTTVVNVPSVQPGSSTDWTATGATGKSAVNCIVRQAQTT